MKLIDVEDLLSDIEQNVVFSGRPGGTAEMRGANKVIDRIKAAPIVEAEPVKEAMFQAGACDRCGWFSRNVEALSYKYCPDCGAKKIGEL